MASRKVVAVIVIISLLLSISIVISSTNLSSGLTKSGLEEITDTSGGVMNKGVMLDPIDMKDVIVPSNKPTKILASNHLPQTPAYEGQDYSQEMVQVNITCATNNGQIDINGVDVSYPKGGLSEVIPLRVPNSGEITVTSTNTVCVGANITDTYQNPQKLNSENKPVVASGGTLIIDPVSVQNPLTAKDVKTFSILGRGDVFTPAKFSYQSIRGAYVSITNPNQNDTTASFYKPKADERGIQKLEGTRSTLDLDLPANSSKVALVPVDFYGQINYSGGVDLQLLGIVKDSTPVFSSLNAPTTQPTVFRDTADFATDFDERHADNSNEDDGYNISFNTVNGGQPIDLASEPYINFTGNISFPVDDKLTNLVLYKNDQSSPMGSASLDLTSSDISANYDWNFYSMLGAEDANIIIIATFDDDKEIFASTHVSVIVPEESTTVVQPSTRIGDDLVDRLISYDDKYIYLSGTEEVRTKLYDSSGNVLDENAPLHVGDILILRTPDTTDKQGEELLRTVNAIWIEGGKTVLDTSKASLPDAVVQAQEDRCNVIPVDDTQPLSFDARADSNNDNDSYAPATSNDVSNTDEYNALRSQYADLSNLGEPDDPQLMNCTADEGSVLAGGSTPSTQSSPISTRDASSTTPAHKPQFTLNIPFQHSWRSTGAACLPVSTGVKVCLQGRGQVDVGLNVKLMFGFHFEMDVKVNWKYVAAAIAIGVAVFLTIEIGSFGIGTAGAIVAGIAAAVGSCILLGCIEFNEFSVSTIFGWQVVAGFTTSGKLTLKVEYEIAKIPLQKSLIMVGFIPVEESVNFVPKLAFEAYSSYGFGWKWSAGQTREIGKKYVRGEGWKDININQKDQGTPASDQPSELFTFGFAFIPIAELSFKLYESLAVYMQARFKFEFINIANCLPLVRENCGGSQSPYLAFRFTISLRVGIKFEIDAGKFKLTAFDLSDDFVIFNIEMPLLCWWPDSNNSCNGMYAYPIPSIDQFTNNSSTEIEQILREAKGNNFDQYLQANAASMHKDQLLMGIAAYMKYHNDQMTNYMRNIISSFNTDTILKLLANDSNQSCGNGCNYLPYSLITSVNKAKTITFRNQTAGCNTAGNRAQYGFVVYDKDGHELQKVPSDYNLSKGLGDRNEKSVDGCVNHEQDEVLPANAYKIKGNFNVGVASTWHRTDFCNVSDKSYGCENGFMILTTKAKYKMGDNKSSHDTITVEGAKVNDQSLLTSQSAARILRSWVDDNRHSTEFDNESNTQIPSNQVLAKKLRGYLNRTDSGDLADRDISPVSASSQIFKDYGIYTDLNSDQKVGVRGYTYDYRKLSDLLSPNTFLQLFGDPYRCDYENCSEQEVSGQNYRLGEFITELYKDDSDKMNNATDYLSHLSLLLSDDDYIAFSAKFHITNNAAPSLGEEILKDKFLELVCDKTVDNMCLNTDPACTEQNSAEVPCSDMTASELADSFTKLTNNRLYNYIIAQISGNSLYDLFTKTYSKTDICGDTINNKASSDYKCKVALFPIINLWLFTNVAYNNQLETIEKPSISAETIINSEYDDKVPYLNAMVYSGQEYGLSAVYLAEYIYRQVLMQQPAFYVIGSTTISALSGQFTVASPNGGGGTGALHFFATSVSKYDQPAWDERAEYCPSGTTEQNGRCISGNHEYPKSVNIIHHDAIITQKATIDESTGVLTNISEGQTIKVTITKDGDTEYAPSSTSVTYTVVE